MLNISKKTWFWKKLLLNILFNIAIKIINEYDLPSQYSESINSFYINKKRKRNTKKKNNTIVTKTLGRIKNKDKIKGKCGNMINNIIL